MTTRTALYRHWDDNDVLLYIGISMNPLLRNKVHLENMAWRGKIAKITIEYFPTRQEAMAAEAAAVVAESPVHNKHYATTDTGRLITDLINQWPTRKDLADEIGASTQQVHKWARYNRIPSSWMQDVKNASQARGLKHVTAMWLLEAHACEESKQ